MSTYWTLYRPSEDAVAGGQLCNLLAGSPTALWAELRVKGWTAKKMAAEGAKFAWVRPTRKGFAVDLHDTLATARHAHTQTLRAFLSKPA